VLQVAVGDTMLTYVGSMPRCDGGSQDDNGCGSVEHEYGSVELLLQQLSGYEFEVALEPDICNFDAYHNVELLLDYLSGCDSRLEDIEEENSEYPESSEDQMCLRCGDVDRNPYEIEYTNRFLAADLIRRVKFSEESSKDTNFALHSEAWIYHGWKLLSRGRRNPEEGLIWTQLQPLWWR
jgi:hypothetical protein